MCYISTQIFNGIFPNYSLVPKNKSFHLNPSTLLRIIISID